MINIPNYEIGRLAGKGGVAEVYLARHKLLDRAVAIKIISPSQTDDIVDKRFLKEAKVVAGLHHPNIVSIYDVGILSNKYYIIMEYLEGGDLKQFVKRGISVSQSLTILKQIASALAHAHSKGFIHRDIKSQNIMFRADGTAVLTDFGIVKDLTADSGYTLDGTSIGTPHYMSPEQAQGAASIDWRTDLYSLGATFYEMLMGHVPYNADSAIAIALKHIKDPVPQLPEQLARFQPIIDKLMAKKPEKRYQSALDLIHAIEAFEGKDLPTEEFRQTVEFGWKGKPIRIFFPLSLITIFLVLVIFNWGYLTTLVNQFQNIPKIKIPKIRVVMPADEAKPPPVAKPKPLPIRQPEQAAVMPSNNAQLTEAIAKQAYSKALDSIKQSREKIHESSGEMLQADQQLEAKQWINAADSYHKILSFQPKNQSAILGLLYAAIEIKQALEINGKPTIEEYGRFLSILNDGLKSPYAEDFQQIKTDTARLAYEIGLRQYEDQNLKPASQWAETGLKFSPDNSQLKLLSYRVMANISLAENRLTLPEKDSALGYYQQILSIEPNDAEAKNGIKLIVEKYKQMTLAAQKNKNYKEAASFIQRARGLDPENEELKKIEWMVLGDQASGKEGAEFYLKALQSDPANPAIKQKVEKEITKVYETGSTKDAKALITSAMKLDPANSKYQDMLQSVNLFENEKNKIYGILNSIKKTQPFEEKVGHYQALFSNLNLASEKFGQGRIAGIRQDAADQVKTDIQTLKGQNILLPQEFADLVKAQLPELKDFVSNAQYDILVNSGDAAGSPKETAAYYLDAFRLDQNRTESRDKIVSLVMNLLKAGMKDEALTILQQASDIAPDNIQFKELIQRNSPDIKIFATNSGCGNSNTILSKLPVIIENIFVCIQYKNMSPDSLVNVTLDNNSGHSLDVPVVLNGRSGNKQVTISAPVEGFSVGKYLIALKQKGKTVSQTYIEFVPKRR